MGEIPRALASNDSHPPLDYLLRHPFVPSRSEWWLRSPSAAMATLALVVLALWMRRRGWLGVLVVGLASVSYFGVLYAHQARMYAAMGLLGTVVAWSAARWLVAASPARWRWLAAGALLAALFTNAGALFFAVGMLSVPCLRRDREAWMWRVCVLGALALWGLGWGPSFVEQARHGASSWIPLTDADRVAATAAGLVTDRSAVAWLVVGALVIGGVALWRMDRVLGWLYVALFAIPFGLLLLAGLHFHVLLPRTLAMSAWAVPLALGALVVAASRSWRLLGPPVCAVVVVLVAISLPDAIHYDEGSAAGLEGVQDVLQPGDAVAVVPRFLWPLAWWNTGVARDQTAIEGTELPNAHVTLWGDDGFDGRIWMIRAKPYSFDPVDGLRPCDGWTGRELGGQLVLECYRARGPVIGGPSAELDVAPPS